MPDEKLKSEVESWKKKFAAGSEGIEGAIKELPRDVVFELVKDPEFGPRVSEAINKSMKPQPQAQPKPPQPQAAGPTQEELDARSAGHAAAAAANRARKEKEEREQKEEHEKKLSVLAKIARMDVGEKAKLAREGDKEARAILIKEGNKIISLSVLSNPRITTQEIDMIAASRNVSEEVLRDISNNRDWMKAYSVALALANNPKTPIGITLTLLPRLMTRDLRFLAKSKGIPDVIRVTARKMAQKRSI